MYTAVISFSSSIWEKLRGVVLMEEAVVLWCFLQWIFWVGPFVGALAAAAYHQYILRAAAIKALGSFRSNPTNWGKKEEDYEASCCRVLLLHQQTCMDLWGKKTVPLFISFTFGCIVSELFVLSSIFFFTSYWCLSWTVSVFVYELSIAVFYSSTSLSAIFFFFFF